MRKIIITSFCLALFTTTVFASSIEVSFNNMATVVPGDDIEMCKTRYGTGYTTNPHKSGVKAHKSSDKGHFIHILKTNVTLHHDVYVMSNEYEISFPTKKGEATTKAYVYATALDKKQGFSGVFTDGQCKGHITITPK